VVGLTPGRAGPSSLTCPAAHRASAQQRLILQWETQLATKRVSQSTPGPVLKRGVRVSGRLSGVHRAVSIVVWPPRLTADRDNPVTLG
jgi:hypothetical protein